MQYVYPAGLTLTEDQQEQQHGYKQVHFLDLNITIEQGKLNCKLYCKRDDFAFECLNLFDSQSTVPPKLIENVITSQLLCFSKICYNSNSFKDAGKQLFEQRPQLCGN